MVLLLGRAQQKLTASYKSQKLINRARQRVSNRYVDKQSAKEQGSVWPPKEDPLDVYLRKFGESGQSINGR